MAKASTTEKAKRGRPKGSTNLVPAENGSRVSFRLPDDLTARIRAEIPRLRESMPGARWTMAAAARQLLIEALAARAEKRGRTG